MSELYVLASIPDQGKTTTAILLGEYFQKQGKKVACLQTEKGPFDVNTYLEKNCYHYTIPLEAAKNKKLFEKWLPKGFDVYIFEITYPYSPIGAAYVDLFKSVNEIISFDLRDSWKECVSNEMHKHWGAVNQTNSDVMALWDFFQKRNVKRVYTKTQETLGEASVDNKFNLVHPEKFVSVNFHPEYTFPKSNKKAIAVGAFPAEYWDIYADLCWYRFDYAAFMERFRKQDYNLAIIGVCSAESLKFHYTPEKPEIVCYQPSFYHNLIHPNLTHSHFYLPLKDDFMTVYRTIKSKSVGTPLGKEGGSFAGYNNKFWTYRSHSNFELIKQEDNMLFCNGWILPQYLIRDGYLEVN
ncbi:MAG: hypothetical protein STSR0009_19880 [Methanoregula sp.]